MENTHKHKGVVRSDTGALRAHPVSQGHKDKYAKQCHTLEINRNKIAAKKVVKKPTEKKEVKKPTVKKSTSEQISVDKDGYVYINLTTSKYKGVRVKFQRTQGRKRKTIGLQIEK